MDLFNYIIIGSGPAGVAAARQLNRYGTCLVDIGETPKEIFPYKSLSDALISGDFKSVLGSNWEMLGNIVNKNAHHAKLRSAGTRFIASGEKFQVYGNDDNIDLTGFASHATGGMSNVWGAQLFRYTQDDLDSAQHWPISINDLEPYYSDLESHVGISGTKDDMYNFLGEANNMLPPIKLVSVASFLLERYNNKRLKNLVLGRPRLAVLTESYRGYPAYDFNDTEFFSAGQSGIYSSSRTLNELIREEKITFLNRYELVSYEESNEFVTVLLKNCDTQELRTIRAKHLLLGCGTIQTTRLVLLNRNANSKKLPFIDHPPVLLPLFIPRMFGTKLPSNSYPIQLIATMNNLEQKDMISFYYPSGLLWSDIIADMPLPFNASLKILPWLLGGMLVAQIWQIAKPCTENTIEIDLGGVVRINYKSNTSYSRINYLLSAMRKIGAYSHERLMKMVTPGWGFHYAGSLPMKQDPTDFETHVDGRLWYSKRVRVIDGSVLPSLPAKNHSFTIMANASRIAQETSQCGY